MQRRDNGVYVAPSQIAGLGLWADRHFEPGERICRYRGVVRRGPFDPEVHGDITYVYEWEDDKGRVLFIDGLDDPSGAMYANDAQGAKRVEGCRNNAGFDDEHWKTDGLWLVAVDDIRRGEEIFVAYGAGYWGMSERKYWSSR